MRASIHIRPSTLHTISNAKVCQPFHIWLIKVILLIPLDLYIAETDERTESSMAGADMKSHESHLGNSGAVATSSMRKPIILSNGSSNAAHEVNSATGMLSCFEYNSY